MRWSLLLLLAGCADEGLTLLETPAPAPDAAVRPDPIDAGRPNDPIDAAVPDAEVIVPPECPRLPEPMVLADGIARDMALSPDGRMLAVITYGEQQETMRLLALPGGEILSSRSSEWLNRALFDASGRTLLIDDGHTLSALDLAIGSEQILSTERCRYEPMLGGRFLFLIEGTTNCTEADAPLSIFDLVGLARTSIDFIQPWTLVIDRERRRLGYRLPSEEIWEVDVETQVSRKIARSSLRPLGFSEAGLLIGGRGDSLSCPLAEVGLVEEDGVRILGTGCGNGFYFAHPEERASIGKTGLAVRSDDDLVMFLPYDPDRSPVMITDGTTISEHDVGVVGPPDDEHVIFNAYGFSLAPVRDPSARTQLYATRVSRPKISHDRMKLAFATEGAIHFGSYLAPIEVMTGIDPYVIDFLTDDSGLFFHFGRPDYQASRYPAPLYFVRDDGIPRLIDEAATGWHPPVVDEEQCLIVYGRKVGEVDQVVVANLSE